jgi:hypothetical protein
VHQSHALVPLSALPGGIRFIFAAVSLRRLRLFGLADVLDSAALMVAVERAARFAVIQCSFPSLSPD